MNSRFVSHAILFLLLSASAAVASGAPARPKADRQDITQDGVILINQERALEGNITPGDTPGFPVTITQPGSYRLSGNLTVPDLNTDGIAVDANVKNVTLDLNGFTINGACENTTLPGCDTSGEGRAIYTGSPASIFNGAVSGVWGLGIFCNSVCDVDRVRVLGQSRAGVVLMVGTVRNSYVSSSPTLDIRVIDYGLVTGNIAGQIWLGGAVGYANNQVSRPILGGVPMGPNLCVYTLCQ